MGLRVIKTIEKKIKKKTKKRKKKRKEGAQLPEVPKA